MIQLQGLTKEYRARRGASRRTVHALRGIDLEIPRGGAVSIIGESGCGKTTLGRILAGMEEPTSGTISIDGQNLLAMRPAARRSAFQRIQMIHQDPYSALSPTQTIGTTMESALALRASQTHRPRSWVTERRDEILGLVGLEPGYVLPRYPHQLSGGMRQRVVFARALTVDPDVLVADEAVSMVDVSMRLGVLELIRRLRADQGISIVFVTHDVAAARYIGEDSEIAVLYRGTVVEQGVADQVIEYPRHPYTQALLSAIPRLRGIEEAPADVVLPITPLDESQSETGCLFAARCPFAESNCTETRPGLVPASVESELGHVHACFHPRSRQVVPR